MKRIILHLLWSLYAITTAYAKLTNNNVTYMYNKTCTSAEIFIDIRKTIFQRNMLYILYTRTFIWYNMKYMHVTHGRRYIISRNCLPVAYRWFRSSSTQNDELQLDRRETAIHRCADTDDDKDRPPCEVECTIRFAICIIKSIITKVSRQRHVHILCTHTYYITVKFCSLWISH